MSSHHDGSYLGDPRFDAVLAELDRRSAVAFIHPVAPSFFDRIEVGVPAFAMEFTFDTTRAAFNLAHTGALERYPDIRFVLSHAGGTANPNGRCNGPVMMTGSTRAANRWEFQHGRCSTDRARARGDSRRNRG
jgi:hypothetical protein